MSPRRVIAAVLAASALGAGPIAIASASAADAAPSYSVSAEYCSGGISIIGYGTLHAATRANTRLVVRQASHPGMLRSVQLRKASRVVKASTSRCKGSSLIG